jgi:protein-disulfide isomerase/uncharacterized membrane protein/rhodanese-related sulfurtransferase
VSIVRKTIAFSLALLGLFLSIYLLWVYASPSHPMVCLGGGCDEVRASSYAHFFGIPTPAFGVAFYVLLAILMFAEAAGKRRLHRVILALAAIGFVVAAALTGVEAFVVHAWCAWCVGQAFAVTLVFILYATGRPRDPREPSMASRYWTVLMVAVIAGSIGFYMLQRAEKSLAETPPPPPAEAIAARLIRPESHVTGNPQSTVTFVEFGDLQCPACAASYPIVRSLRQQYGDRVKFSFRHFPLPTIHVFAMKAAEASECAAQQGKFWEYVDRAYDSKGDLKDESLEGYAGELGLDKDRFHQCLATDATLPQVQRDQADGLALGVRPTPTFFVGKRRIEGALTEYQFSTMLLDDLQSAAKLSESPSTPLPSAGAPPAPEKTAEKKSAPAAPGTALNMSGGTSSGGFLNVKGASTDCSPDAPKGPEPPLIHTADAQKKLQQGAVFVDVRSTDDFAKAHIKGARSVPLLEVERRAGELPKDRQIVVYEAGTAPGDVCAAAKSSARVLISRGYQAVVYQDGMKGWEKSGGAVEK